MVTPFGADGAVDFGALEALIDNIIEGGMDYVVALGTTAETPTLNHAERAAVRDFVRGHCQAINAKAHRRVGVVLGMGGNDTAKLCGELRELDPSGFDAVLTVAPYYNKPTQEGLFQHYRAVAGASPLPVILYNIPGRTGVNMTAETTLRIAREVPGVVGVKEASGDLAQMEAILKGAPEGFVVLSGDDAITLPLVEKGGHGVISVMANAFPARFSSMVHAALQGDMAGAQEIWDSDFEELCPLLFAEGNPAGVKTVMSLQGVCRPDVRLPLVAGSEGLRSAIAKLL